MKKWSEVYEKYSYKEDKIKKESRERKKELIDKKNEIKEKLKSDVNLIDKEEFLKIIEDLNFDIQSEDFVLRRKLSNNEYYYEQELRDRLKPNGVFFINLLKTIIIYIFGFFCLVSTYSVGKDQIIINTNKNFSSEEGVIILSLFILMYILEYLR